MFCKHIIERGQQVQHKLLLLSPVLSVVFYCVFLLPFFCPAGKWFVANKILFMSSKAGGDNKVHVIAAKRFKLFSLKVHSSHLKS